MSTLFATYISTSRRLGLAFEEGRIHGVVDGIALQMWFGVHSVHVGALLPRPAPVDLSIAPKTLIGKLGDLFGGHGDEIGDPTFDKLFATKSSNVARVAQLLNPDARKALLELEADGYHPAVDATTIHLRRFSASSVSDPEEKVEHDFRAAARLAKVIGASFE